MDTLIRYGGAYLAEDLLLNRMGVSDARSFNDPFEFHFKPGKPLSTAQAKLRIRQASERPAAKLHYEMIAKEIGRKELKKNIRSNKKGLIEGMKTSDVISMNGFRDQIFTFTDEISKIVCCTQPNVEDAAENAMWAYYAGNHMGVRLHLNHSFYKRLERWLLIKYEDSPVAYEAWGLSDIEIIQDFVIDVIIRTSPA